MPRQRAATSALLVAAASLAGCHWFFAYEAAHDSARARDLVTGDGAPLPDAARSPDWARDVRPDLAKPDAKKAEASVSPCDKNGICESGESCGGGCSDCCGCHDVDCAQPNTKCTGAGTLTTLAGSWKPGVPQQIAGPFSLAAVAAGKLALRVHLCELDLSKIGFTGTSPTSAKGAYVGFGVASTMPNGVPYRPANGIWYEVTSEMPSTGDAYWNGGPFTHTDGYRKYMFQTWISGSATPSPLGHQYNLEKSVVLGAKYAGADVLDLRLEVTAGSGTYTYQAFSRLKLSAATVDGCNFAYPWNYALNNTPADLAWIKFRKSYPSGPDFETASLGSAPVSLYIWAFSGASASNTPYTITWKRAAVEHQP
jgi:hypothetical protein